MRYKDPFDLDLIHSSNRTMKSPGACMHFFRDAVVLFKLPDTHCLIYLPLARGSSTHSLT